MRDSMEDAYRLHEFHQILDSAIAGRPEMVLFLECGTNDTFGKVLDF